MSEESIAKGTAGQTALFGFAIKAPTPAPRKRSRKPPLRVCGGRHWPKVCPACLGLEPPAWAADSAQLAELPGETFEDIFGGAA